MERIRGNNYRAANNSVEFLCVCVRAVVVKSPNTVLNSVLHLLQVFYGVHLLSKEVAGHT